LARVEDKFLSIRIKKRKFGGQASKAKSANNNKMVKRKLGALEKVEADL